MAPQQKSFWSDVLKTLAAGALATVIAVPVTMARLGAKVEQNTVDIQVQRGQVAVIQDARALEAQRIAELIQKISSQQEQIAEIKMQIRQVGSDVVVSKEMAAETRTDLRWIKDMMRAQAQQK